MMPKIPAANTGVFSNLDVPGHKASATLARGDFDVPAERGRRVLRVHLDAHVVAGLTTLKEAIRQALA